MSLEEMLHWLRGNGWAVAVHNDYTQHGMSCTFWLFTHKESGRFVHGEGHSDVEAVKEAHGKAYTLGLEGRLKGA
jgi:hypothetical protein